MLQLEVAYLTVSYFSAFCLLDGCCRNDGRARLFDAGGQPWTTQRGASAARMGKHTGSFVSSLALPSPACVEYHNLCLFGWADVRYAVAFLLDLSLALPFRVCLFVCLFVSSPPVLWIPAP